MSKRAPRGSSISPSRHDSRENSDREENESFLTYSTPIAKRKHRQPRDDSNEDAETLNADPHASNSSFPMHHRRDHSTVSTFSSSSSASTLLAGPSYSSSSFSSSKVAGGGGEGAEVDEISTATLVTAAIEPLGIAMSAPAIVLEATSPHHQQQMGQEVPYTKWSTIGHQASFLATGIFSTIAVQWLYYEGAASGTTMLSVFFNYIGMMSVGLVYAAQSWYADRKQRRLATAATVGGTHFEYGVLTTDLNEMSETHGHDDDGDRGVKDHIELVGNKISTGLRHHHAPGAATSTGADVYQIGNDEDTEEEDEDDEEFDEIDVEKQRLRMLKNNVPSSSSAGAAEKTSFRSRTRLHWPVIQVAVMDVIANALVTVGFFYVGSGMYQVIYSSIVIWCAILTRIFLSRKLNNIQWLAIFGVTLGLAISAVGTVQDASPDDGPGQSWLEKSFGALVTLGATFLYACVYVLSDKVLSTFKPTPVPEKVCSMVGGYASILTFIYLCIHTFPNWQTEVMDVVQAHNGSWLGIMIVYPLVTISSMLHSLNYYVLLSRINNIAVGIMQSLRAVLVFVMSHYLFCGVSSTQCFNEWKFISAIVVIGCVTLFSFNSAPSATSTPTAEAPSTGAESSTVVVKGLSPSRGASPIPRLSSTQRRSSSTRSS
ncbi:hypothetical protein EDD21DRAFT_364115 [Dissophora ornata]|nr:hypothetical protein EDD21DRAFT_364115 [Dissophora ornata]